MAKLEVTWPRGTKPVAVYPIGDEAGRIRREWSKTIMIYDRSDDLALASLFVVWEKKRERPGDLELLAQEQELIRATKNVLDF